MNINKHIYIELFGGLGNTMFQIAFGIAISKIYKRSLYMIQPVNNPHKTCDYSEIYKNCIFKEAPKHSKKINELHANEQKWNVGLSFPKLPDDSHIILYGYWQVARFFNDYKSEIIDFFGLPVTTIVNSVAIHVRRGDYLKYQNVHPVCNIEYYMSGINYIEKINNSPKFYYIYSDDIEWCKTHFKFLKNKEFILKNEIETLKHMVSCEYFIIANSTFSWWGAYLSNCPESNVVAPKNWINTIKNSDIYCDGWIKL